MKHYPIVLSIGCSDSVGGAGLQADTKTITSLGAYAATVVSSLVIQTTNGEIKKIHPIPLDFIQEQISAVMEDIQPDVVKIGFVNDVEVIQAIADNLRKYHPRYVVFSPVILSLDGQRYIEDSAIKVIKEELFQYTNLICMTVEEAEIFTKIKGNSIQSMTKSARSLAKLSRMSVLLKMQSKDKDQIHNILCLPTGREWVYEFNNPPPIKIHGVVSTLSAAISTNLALQYSLEESVMKGLLYINDAIIKGEDIQVGRSFNSICHTFNPEKMHVIDYGF